MPQVTVLLPVHNGEEYLEQAIASVLAQSFRDFEVLIINDGSTDRTQSIIDAFNDGRIRCIRHKTNRRLIAVLNEGLDLATAPYVARMDADDICHPRRLELQHRFLEDHPDVGVVGSAVRSISDGTGRGPIYRFPEQHEVIEWALAFLCPLVHPSVMMRRDLVLSVGGYAPSALHVEDYDLWERMSRYTRFANLPDVLLGLRKHGSSITSREAMLHVKNVAVVAARCLSARLGRAVSTDAAARLIRIAPCGPGRAEEAAQMLLELYEAYAHTAPQARTIIRRDTGIRLLMLSMRGGLSPRILWRATRLAPGAWIGLIGRAMVKLTGRGVLRAVG